jgi:hypothetical protein
MHLRALHLDQARDCAPELEVPSLALKLFRRHVGRGNQRRARLLIRLSLC